MDKQKLINWIEDNRVPGDFKDHVNNDYWAIIADDLINAIKNGKFDESGE